MEERIDGEFVDAVDEFSYYDCLGPDQVPGPTSDSSFSLPEPPKEDVVSLEIHSSAPSLRRRSISRRFCGDEFEAANYPDSSSVYSSVTHVLDSKARRYELHRELKENEKNLEKSKPTYSPSDMEESVDIVGENEESTVTTKSDGRFGDTVDSVEEPRVSPSSSLLVFFAGLVIKAMAFQMNVLVKLFKFPFLALYCFFMFVVDPLGALRRGRRCLTRKLLNFLNHIWGIVGGLMSKWLIDHKSIWTLVLRFSSGFLWSVYVGVALFCLLIFSLAISGFLVRNLVEEPVEIKEKLNFDYAKGSPVALVPIWSCAAVGCGVNCKENVNVWKSKGSRLIPVNHKLQVIISLTMPESQYNRNLGIFQVRVDFLSASGETFASSSHPCMLKFKSEPIRLLLTFLNIFPLVAGYISESQTANLKIRGYTEGDVPTACLKVILEQRAEFKPGAGIPEIYDASLVLESELPLLKRILWMWKKTVFVWSCMLLFMIELLFTLVCCRTLIVPRPRPRNGSFGNGNVHSGLQQQGS